MKIYRPTYVQVHLDRLMANFRRIQKFNPGQPFLCPMIKANAYGHGDVAVAKALVKENCDFLGVACVEEGIRLRENFIDTTILVFGFHGRSAVKELLARRLTPVVSNFRQLEILVEEVKGPVGIHIKFNTGMNRLGFFLRETSRINDLLIRNPLIQVDGLCSHFYSGEAVVEEGSSAERQLREFERVVKRVTNPVKYHHLYNSSAITALYKKGVSLKYGSRPGLLVYGIDPGENQSLKPLVSPVMEFKSKIVGTHEVKSGEVVSYGGTWQASRDSVIGIVPAGYGDGIARSLSNKGEVLVCGQRTPIAGRVCMDYTMIDLTDVKLKSSHFVDQEVVFWGQQEGEEICVEEVAKVSGRITYELMTGVSERVPRFYGANIID